MNRKKPLETKLQSKMMNYIRSNYRHSIVFKLEKASVDHVPDIYSSIPGFGSCWIEAKRDEKSATKPGQIAMEAQLNKAGTESRIIHSWEEFMMLITFINEEIANASKDKE